MILAAVRDTPYNIVLFLHIVTVVIGLAPAVVHPLLFNQARQDDAAAKSTLFSRMAQNGQRIFANAFIVAGLLGFALVGMSDEVWAMGDLWVLLSILVWVAATGLLHGALIPAERAAASGEPGAEDRIAKLGGIATVLILVLLYLMVFKPGS